MSSEVDGQRPPRFLVIGAGSRGTAYAKAIVSSTNGQVVAIAEPDLYKRNAFGQRFIWKDAPSPQEGQSFSDWKDYVEWETRQRAEGFDTSVNGVFVCVLDEMHAEVVVGLASLKLHIMCEKPLATNLRDCARMARSVDEERLFSICHVLRYSPHNMMLRRLLLEQEVIGDILSVEHTEPVGWWHFSHSYVRGNWRKESKTAPSLLTKSCHDVDFLLWLLCSPNSRRKKAHLPSTVSSAGSLSYFKKSRKPKEAGTATNCLSCPIEKSCIYSAKRLYHDSKFLRGDLGWPVKIVIPDLEDTLKRKGVDAASARLLDALREDYDPHTALQEDIDKKPWFGRCVYEAGNDVCDDQAVTLFWDDDFNQGEAQEGRGSKTATFHMVAFTEAICERRTRIYGTQGEIEADSNTIKIYDFATARKTVHHPKQEGGGHGGGDAGLVRQFVRAVEAVMGGEMGVEQAQREHIGCDLEEILRSHAMVFAAEEARRERKVVDWEKWWDTNVATLLSTNSSAS